jgi:hypothetical protein
MSSPDDGDLFYSSSKFIEGAVVVAVSDQLKQLMHGINPVVTSCPLVFQSSSCNAAVCCNGHLLHQQCHQNGLRLQLSAQEQHLVVNHLNAALVPKELHHGSRFVIHPLEFKRGLGRRQSQCRNHAVLQVTEQAQHSSKASHS